ncbi:MAG TPA: DUF1998 domain-containing protein [Hyphomicrobiaceae bacterium]|nr:DUF1998 domain-containing protein [Hyphomicrobiaceae bacterium]
MAENQIRLSQLIGYYGPGAMLDLPDRSVLVMGLDHWDQRSKAFRLIEEPRLSRLLRMRLESDNRLATGGSDPQLRTPPLDLRDPHKPSPKIKATVFPLWFVCDTLPGDRADRRRLVRFQQLEAPKRSGWRGDDGKRRRVSPIRFVCGCQDGHLQDVNWHRVVHQNAPGREGCQEPLWLEDGGTTGDPRQTRIYCECGASLSLNDLFQPGRLGQCRGEWPWINGGRDPEGCKGGHMLRLLTRSATNTYFPQVSRVISLPASADQLAELVRSVWTVLQRCASRESVKQARQFNPQVEATLEGYSDEEVWSRIVTMQGSEGQVDQAENPLLAELAMLASGQAVIGTPTPDALLHAETLQRSVWDPEGAPVLRGISSLVAVHRLREVACLYGFTRFEPAPVVTDDLEDVGLAVRGAPLARSPKWLPAIEQFGEGLFFTLDREALKEWRSRKQVENRTGELDKGADRWLQQRRQRGENVSDRAIRDKRRPEYLLAHSLAHALITEVAIDCGYPASSIRERIYVSSESDAAAATVGILIYTASAGTQGTLGGLVEVTRRFGQVLENALERQRLCSGDPVCADHEPATAADDRTLHGAACHGCLVIAETSCEARNLFLDRALLIDTVGPSGVGFF